MDERIIKYFDSELSAEERISLLRESEVDPSLRKDLLDVQNIRGISLLSSEAGKEAEAVAEKEYRRFMQGRRVRKIVRIALSAAAYAAVGSLLVMLTWSISRRTVDKSLAVVTSPAVHQELYVPPGQRARISLPDGTSVWLNAGSTLRYPSLFTSARKVELSGEAYFDVAPDKSKPFIVFTEKLEVAALGTAFNVYAYPGSDYASAMLVSGTVRVRGSKETQEGITLKPGQQIVYAGGSFRTEKMDSDGLLWKDGVYTFKNLNMEEIIAKLELYYDVDIVVGNPQILKYRYTGKFRQRDGAMEILRIIQKIHRFKIHKNEEENRITLE